MTQPGNNTPPITAISGSKVALTTENIALVDKVSYNVRQELILITRDKIELCLIKHVKAMEQRLAWLIPLGIFITILTTLLTSDFHDIAHLKADSWRAIFVVGALISGVWTVLLLLKVPKAKSIDEVIGQLQAQGVQDQSTERTESANSALETTT